MTALISGMYHTFSIKSYCHSALFYDEIMRSVPYEIWAEFLNHIFKSAGCKTVYECACGTGKIAELMWQKGFYVTGSDKSRHMVKKAQRNYPHLSFFAADMTTSPLKKSFDAVCCIYDSVNHLNSEKSLELFLATSRQILNPGGMLVFDFVTHRKIQNLFNGGAFYQQFEHVDFVWECMQLSDTMYRIDGVYYYKKTGKKKYEKYKESYIKQIFSPETVKYFLEKQGLTNYNFYDDFTFMPCTDISERIVCVAGKDKE